MAMRMLPVAALGLALALPALGPAAGETLSEKTGLNRVTGASPTSADFVTEAAIDSMFETRSSELAAIRGDERARIFAAKMNEDHQKAASALSMAVKPHIDRTPLPARLDDKHQAMLDKLKGLEGAAFDMQYREDQVDAHKAAVSLFERYAEGGDDPALQAFAKKTLPILRHHLKMAEDLEEKR